MKSMKIGKKDEVHENVKLMKSTKIDEIDENNKIDKIIDNNEKT